MPRLGCFRQESYALPWELGCGPSQVLRGRRPARSKNQAGKSRRQNFSVFQFSKIERIKQIRADVPTCNYQLISLDFFKKREISK